MSKQARQQRAAGTEWFNSLQPQDKWTLGDHFVWGIFDWREWGFQKPPSATFLNAADQARIHWEIFLDG